MATGMILDKLKVKKGKEQGCVTTVEVEVPQGMVQDAMHNVWLRIQVQARLPGFRPGKAPLAMIQQQFAGEAKERAIRELIEKSVPDAMKQLSLNPVSQPEVHDLKFDHKTLSFQFDVEQAPKLELKTYKKLKATRKRYAATEEEVNKRLEELREGNARLEKAPEEAVEGKHYVVVDFEASVDGRALKEGKGTGELVDMSSPQTVDGLTQGLLGMKRGEVKDVPVTLENKAKASFHVTVKEIKTKVVPALDDEFGKDVGFATLAELKKNLSELIENEGKARAERELTAQLEEALLKNHSFDVPPSLVAGQLERLAERVRDQLIGPGRELPEEEHRKLREKLAPRAQAEVKLSFLLSAIARAEKIETTEEDVKADLERTLQDAPNDERRRGIRRFFEEHADEIKAMIRDRKTVAFLKDNASITEA